MEKEAGQMVTSRVEAVELIVQYVGEPCQGVPVGCLHTGECPHDAFYSESLLNVGIACNVYAVFKYDEIMPSYLCKNSQHSNK